MFRFTVLVCFYVALLQELKIFVNSPSMSFGALQECLGELLARGLTFGPIPRYWYLLVSYY